MKKNLGHIFFSDFFKRKTLFDMVTLIKTNVLHPILYIRSTVEKKICETMFPCVQQNQKKTWLKNLLKNIMMNIYYMRIKDCIEFVFKTRREKK